MKNLHLNLKKKWFDMILSGTKTIGMEEMELKTEEYREIKPWIISRLFDYKKIGMTKEYFISAILSDFENAECWSCLKEFDTIIFSNGYAKNREQMIVVLEKIEIRQGFEKWGAKNGISYFVFSLGKVISVGSYEL